jgi:ArsR family metal-binding transcriptional regulator
MLIEAYDVDLQCPACEPGAEIWTATVTAAADLSELMPYVNAVVDRGQYAPSVPTLVWRDGPHKLFLRPHQFGVSNVRDRAQADARVAALVQFLNDTWEGRHRITPDHTTRTKPKVLDVLRLLPRSNCGDCGVPSCMAFAVALCEGDKNLEACPTLVTDPANDAPKRLIELGL